jgi:DNA-binding GntR family transcriptional regulator
MIVHGTLAPGRPLIERPLAERLDVSRASLRSALQRLEHEGFVRFSAAGVYSRAWVTPLTVSDMEEIYGLIALFNGAAARLAALLPAARRREIAAAMRKQNDKLAALLKSPNGSFAALYDLDDQFHRQCIDGAGGIRLRALYDAVSSQGERYGRAYASAIDHTAIFRRPASSSPAEHQAIIDAIVAGDAGRAEAAALLNWRNATERLRRVIVSAGERGSY